ncbi:hypothetical protein CP973_13425 [Streptomyces albofaciens JCM 4342]|uniref:hypothetical protein n=1 Tax=Streptomyces albofaciens TaxID=66866 RepID=UPI00123B4FFC|nr:hypothetical protein [Streptomyces albofaciens]KAA6222794.1 hypothetical protein CP973_13425 [Streptomyces albofaciens JCM 4342]
MKIAARVAIAASVVVVVLMLAGVVYISLYVGWLPGRAKPGDVVGTWAGPHGARVALRADGSATATEMPSDHSGYDPVDTFSGEGTWTLRRATNSLAEQYIQVEVGTGPGKGATIELVVDGDGARDGLHVPVSADSALGIDFRRAS